MFKKKTFCCAEELMNERFRQISLGGVIYQIGCIANDDKDKIYIFAERVIGDGFPFKQKAAATLIVDKGTPIEILK